MGERYYHRIEIGGDPKEHRHELVKLIMDPALCPEYSKPFLVQYLTTTFCDATDDWLEDLKMKLREMQVPYDHYTRSGESNYENLACWRPGYITEKNFPLVDDTPVILLSELTHSIEVNDISVYQVIDKYTPPELPPFVSDGTELNEPEPSENAFTIVGYYDDTLQRYCGTFHGATWVDAVQACISSVGTASTLMIVDVFEGELKPLTEAQSVEPAVDFPMPESDKPLTKKMLLQSLREEFEDNMEFGGKTWWREDLAQQFELTPEQLFDRDHDTGLLFELKEDGELSADWRQRRDGSYDYLVSLKGSRIEWE